MFYAVMRLEKIKSLSGFSGIERHDRDRESLRLYHPEKTCENKHIVAKQYYSLDQPLRERFDLCLNGQKIRKNGVLAYEIVLTFSPEAASQIPLREWVLANANWLSSSFGGQKNVLDVSLHMDEKTPHLHAVICPIDPNGHLNAKYYTGSKKQLSELQDSYAAAMAPYGLTRGIKYYDSRVKKYHKDHKKWTAEQLEIERKKIEEIKKEMFR